MTDLAARAFRRPVTSRELDQIRRARAPGAGEGAARFDEGLAVGIQALLGVARFPVPHRARSAGDGRPRRRTGSRSTSSRRGCRTSCGRACRTRELRRAADAGTLRNPAVLAAQCAGCCAIRSRARWPRTSPDSGCSSARSNRSPAIASASRTSRTTCGCRCGRETELFVEHVIREDRSILDFIDGRYSFLNERLARHYGIAERHRPGVPSRRSDRHPRAAAWSRTAAS